MKIWKAHYKDHFHDTDIEIINTQKDYSTNPLSFTLDGITFSGSSIGDFCLKNQSQYNAAKEKFCLVKWGGNDNVINIKPEYTYELQRYSMDLYIPLMVVRKSDGCELQRKLHIAFQYIEHDLQKNQVIIKCDNVRVYRDDAVVSDFSLCIEDRIYRASKKSLYFEQAFLDFSRQIKQEYYIKSCFTCQYSDYSPYGCDDYGTMLCYCRHKAEYLKVNYKDDFFRYIEMKDCDIRQEDDLCNEYEARNQCAGYRGFVDGLPEKEG